MNSDDPYQSKPTPLESTVILIVVLGGFGMMFWIANEGRSLQSIWNGIYPYLLSGGTLVVAGFLWRRPQKPRASKVKEEFWASLLFIMAFFGIAELIKLMVSGDIDWDAIIFSLGAIVFTALGAWFRFGFWHWVFTTDIGKKHRTILSDSHKK